jgi:hypothetical protein
MLQEIGSVANIPKFIEGVKSKKMKLMGFGHRVYKNHDPRARIIRQLADEVFSILGREPLIEVAVALEKVALSDPYFIERKLYPNVDFYSGLIYKAMGFPTDYFPVLFTIPRTVGWLAHWSEFLDDPENKIVRPRQIYLGSKVRPAPPCPALPLYPFIPCPCLLLTLYSFTPSPLPQSRDFVPMEERTAQTVKSIVSPETAESKRRNAAGIVSAL